MSDTTHTTRTAARAAFTLIELTIVVLILGIIAAITVPKIFEHSDTATDNGLRRTLQIMRDAIDMYAVNNAGAWPGSSASDDDDVSQAQLQANFKSNLAPYLRGPFPVGPVGPAKGDDRVRTKFDGVPLNGGASPGRAWKYDNTTGEFIYNYNGISSDGVTRYDEF